MFLTDLFKKAIRALVMLGSVSVCATSVFLHAGRHSSESGLNCGSMLCFCVSQLPAAPHVCPQRSTDTGLFFLWWSRPLLLIGLSPWIIIIIFSRADTSYHLHLSVGCEAMQSSFVGKDGLSRGSLVDRYGGKSQTGYFCNYLAPQLM